MALLAWKLAFSVPGASKNCGLYCNYLISIELSKFLHNVEMKSAIVTTDTQSYFENNINQTSKFILGI